MTTLVELSELTEVDTPLEGIVKWFNAEKGFGVIKHNGDGHTAEYFVHHTNINTKETIRSYLEEGEKVLFIPASESSGKLKALKVTAQPDCFLACEKNKVPKTTSHKKNTLTRNTTSFKPQNKSCDMRILCGWLGYDALLNKSLTTKDVAMLDPFIPKFGLFEASREYGGEHGLPVRLNDSTWYDFFKEELLNTDDEIMKLWHGDSHLIADDRLNNGKWKETCPRINNLIQCVANMFNMKVTSTRINEYRDGNDWKPYHHDAAALKEDMKLIQNITVSVSFGGLRSVAFQSAKNETSVCLPLLDGYIYSFGSQVNIDFKHGILRDIPETAPRFSIVLWGWVDQREMAVYS